MTSDPVTNLAVRPLRPVPCRAVRGVFEGLSCPDVMVARDSLPSVPFLGAIVYVDHEAGARPSARAARVAPKRRGGGRTHRVDRRSRVF